jgi:hypothetical protein
MVKDLIIGVVDRYRWDDIKCWANSIEMSGFDGIKAVITYNMDGDTVRTLIDKGFSIIGAGQKDHDGGFSCDNKGRSIMIDRFFNIYEVLSRLDNRESIGRVIITDVRDVIFQLNPTVWLDEEENRAPFRGDKDMDIYLPKKFLVLGSENMAYGDEPWNTNNMKHAFGPFFLDRMRGEPIYCAGVIAGSRDEVQGLCFNVWMSSRLMYPFVNGGGGPDQAALNLVMKEEPFKSLLVPASPQWVVHAGTSRQAVYAGSGGVGEAFKRGEFNADELQGMFIENRNYAFEGTKLKAFYGEGHRTTTGTVCVVHQWDRVPEWNKKFAKLYGDIND